MAAKLLSETIDPQPCNHVGKSSVSRISDKPLLRGSVKTADFQFLSPDFYLQDRDAAYSDLLQDVRPKPVVFIMGLHRSGTTFTLHTLHETTGAAALTVHDIAFYRQRMFGRFNDLEAQQVAELERYFRRFGLNHRPIDKVPLSARTLDEYGFLYRRLNAPQDGRLLREIVRKLSFLYAAAPVVLLKEPSTFAEGSSLVRTFPEAKLVYVHRDPVSTMLSRYRTWVWRRSWNRDWAYLHLLTGRRPGTSARVKSLLLPRTGKRAAANRIAQDIVTAVRRYQEDLARIPPGQALHFEFEDLVTSPGATVARVLDFLGASPVKPLADLKSSPRRGINIPGAVREVSHQLADSLRQLGYEHSSLSG